MCAVCTVDSCFIRPTYQSSHVIVEKHWDVPTRREKPTHVALHDSYLVVQSTDAGLQVVIGQMHHVG